jgi:hypothetical protein
MIKSILTLSLLATFSVLQAQRTDSVSLGSPITQQVPRPLATDSISLGAATGGFSYPNDVYYNMQTGAKTTVVGYNWHLAFAVRKMSPPTRFMQAATILANEGRGVSVFQSPLSWSTFDTAGYTSWVNPHNSDSTWDLGALNTNRNGSNPFDFGWGTYDMNSHNIVGATVYLVRMIVGSGPSSTTTFRKVMVSSLEQDSIWTIHYANIDNSDSTTVTINKSDYAGKLFAYQNLNNDTTYNREPATKWDAVFTRYGAYVTQFNQTIFSTNTGVLTFPDVTVSEIRGTSVEEALPGTFINHITAIGTDWKENPGPGQPSFRVLDSVTYFTKDAAANENKFVFSAFRGSSTGVIVFKRASTTPNTITLETYPMDVFYNMETGKVKTTYGSNWHLAFAIRNAQPPFNVMQSTTILANEGRGVSVFLSPQPLSDWNVFDTTGFRTWNNPHNSDSTWDIGALNVYRDSSNMFDFGWGEYSQITHDLEATKMFLVRITTGVGQNATQQFRKIKIDKLAFDTQWVFTYANIDGSNSRTVVFNKSDFAGKLFAYQDMLSDTLLDREPSEKWDLLFTRYGANYTQFGQTVFSTNTGALSYPTLLTSKVSSLPTDSAIAGVYTNNITNIGTNWKENPGPGQPFFRVYDSLTYFTKRDNNREDKLVFNSFEGSSTGLIIFTKTNIRLGTGLTNVNGNILSGMYPNPASNTLYLEFADNQTYTVTIVDVTGKALLTTTASRNNNNIDVSALNPGMYFVRLQNNISHTAARLIIR